jgi:hypothetical protein
MLQFQRKAPAGGSPARALDDGHPTGTAAEPALRRPLRRIAGALAVASGLGLIVFTFATSAFVRTSDGARVLHRFRAVTTTQGFNAFHAAYAETANAVEELVTRDYPAFARDFKLSDAQFPLYVSSHFVAVADGVATLRALPSLINPVANGVAALPDGKFEPAYSLPLKGVSLRLVPWLLLGVGLALLAAGIAIWRRPGRWAPAVLLLAGLAMVVVPLAISLPSKTEQTARIVDLAKVGLSPTSATRSEQASYAANEMVRELEAGLLPALAGQLHVSTAAFEQQLRTQSPALSRFLADWPTLAPANFKFAADIRTGMGEFDEVKSFPFEAIPWLVITLGGMLSLAAGAVLVTGRARARAALPPTGSPGGGA